MPSHPIQKEIQAATAAQAAEKTPRQILVEVAAEAKASHETIQSTANACRLLCEATTRTIESTTAGTKVLESAPETISDLRKTATSIKETAQNLKAVIPPAGDVLLWRPSTTSARNILLFSLALVTLQVFWIAKVQITDLLGWVAAEVRAETPSQIEQRRTLNEAGVRITRHEEMIVVEIDARETDISWTPQGLRIQRVIPQP